MSFIHKHARLLLVAASCVALGAGASAIATAGAATNHPLTAQRATPPRSGPAGAWRPEPSMVI